MKLLVLTGALIAVIGLGTAALAVTLELSSEATNQINVTTDSSRGWIPTTEQRQSAIKTVELFLDAVESGRYADAYGMQTEILRHHQTLEQFTQGAQKFRDLAGTLKFWRALKVTWTKDPAQAPSPGVYVAVDLAAQFSNVDRACGYIVLYQKPIGGDFAIMRRENNYLDNVTAQSIEEKRSRAEVAKIWAQLSRNCPNYVPSLGAR